MSLAPPPPISSIYNTNILRHFGLDVIANKTGLSVDDSKVTILWLKLYKVPPFYFLYYFDDIPIPIQEFIEAIDAIDNGISQYPTDIKPLYRSRTDLSSRVGALNPAWNQPADSETVDACHAFRLVADIFSYTFYRLNLSKHHC